MICSARLYPGVGYIQVCLTLPVCARAYRCIREAFNPTLTPTGAPFIATSHGNRRGTVECLCTSIYFFLRCKTPPGDVSLAHVLLSTVFQQQHVFKHVESFRPAVWMKLSVAQHAPFVVIVPEERTTRREKLSFVRCVSIRLFRGHRLA